MLRFIPRSHRIFTEEQKQKLRPYTGVQAALLFARGIETAEEAELFLHPDFAQLHDPYLLSDMEKAVQLIENAKASKHRVVVYGDYDTDGVCAASLLTEALQAYGMDAAPYLPLRDDGYGLNAQAVETLAKSYQLLITVDLGITNADEVTLAKKLGMTVIVTDHHQPGLVPCPADAVINPLLNSYPFPYLCGAGVAYKLAAVLHAGNEDVLMRLLPLAAVATIADIVSLTGENRVITALGLPLVQGRLGLQALMDAAGVKAPVSESAVGYQLAPRLNAAGRVADANAAVRLLLTDDPKEAQRIAEALDSANTERKQLEQNAVKEAMEQAQGHDFVRRHVLFVRGEGWHKGVLGLAAGRLNRKYAVPVCALSEEDGMLHGSLRGVQGVNLAACLKQCDDVLVKYGGHEMAAGVTLAVTQYDAFCERLEAAVTASADAQAFVPAQAYDLALNLEDADFTLLDALELLRPFGTGNPTPVFLTSGVRLDSRRACGMGGAHLQLKLRQDQTVLSGIAFGRGGDADTLPDEVDAAYTLERNEFRGNVSVQCHVSALRPYSYAIKRALAAEDAALYQDALIARLTEQAGKPEADAEKLNSVPSHPSADALLDGCQGTLYVAYTKDSATRLLQKLEDRVDVAAETVGDPRCFHTLLLRPAMAKLSPHWRHIVLLDGALSAEDEAWWRAQCGNAVLMSRRQSPALCKALKALDAGDDAYRGLYKLLRRSAFVSLQETAVAADMPQAQVMAGLHAFDELGLMQMTLQPFAYRLLPAAKCSLDDSTLLNYIRGLAGGENNEE